MIRNENRIWCDRVKRVRKAYGLTQEGLAAVLKIRRETVTLWESRIDRPYSAGVERLIEMEARMPGVSDGKAGG